MAKRRHLVKTYSIWNELNASPSEPLSLEQRRHQLTRMYEGLHAFETAAEPTKDDWAVLSDAVNLLETLIRDMQICEDTSGLLNDAIVGLVEAGNRNRNEGKPLRLDGKGIQAVRSVLADYAELVAILPARTMIRCHRLTEQRIHAILNGKQKKHDFVL